MEVRISFQIYTITLMCFFGWWLMCIYLPTGMQAIPFELVDAWHKRPVPLSTADFNYKKAELAQKIKIMLQQGKELVDEKKKLAARTESWWMCTRWRAKSLLKAKQHQFEKNCVLAECEF